MVLGIQYPTMGRRPKVGRRTGPVDEQLVRLRPLHLTGRFSIGQQQWIQLCRAHAVEVAMVPGLHLPTRGRRPKVGQGTIPVDEQLVRQMATNGTVLADHLLRSPRVCATSECFVAPALQFGFVVAQSSSYFIM